MVTRLSNRVVPWLRPGPDAPEVDTGYTEKLRLGFFILVIRVIIAIAVAARKKAVLAVRICLPFK